jgi:hypothetical protein
MMTLEDEFQKPVRDRLAEILIPTKTEIDIKHDWKLDILVPSTSYDQWMRQAMSYQDTQVKLAAIAFDDIARGEHGSIHGEFPTPTPRKRKRVRNKNK